MQQTTDFYTLVVHYKNGEKQTFKVPVQGDSNTLAKRIDEFRNHDELVIHTEDNKLILIPFNNVQRLEVEPFPEVYAKNMLHRAKILG